MLSRQPRDLPHGVLQAQDADDALALARRVGGTRICVAGGGEVYRLFLPRAGALYLSEIDLDATGDVRFPEISTSEWTLIDCEHVPGEPAYAARIYRRR